jgi:hypothetical protein
MDYDKIRQAIERYVKRKLEEVNPISAREEANYVSFALGALAGKLNVDGLQISFKFTPVDARGQGSAESITGVDFCIRIQIIDKFGLTVKQKTSLAQAKKTMPNPGTIKWDELEGQVINMMKALPHNSHDHLVFIRPTMPFGMPQVHMGQCSWNQFNQPSIAPKQLWSPKETLFADYLSKMVKCEKGYQSGTFYQKTEDSGLPALCMKVQDMQ